MPKSFTTDARYTQSYPDGTSEVISHRISNSCRELMINSLAHRMSFVRTADLSLGLCVTESLPPRMVYEITEPAGLQWTYENDAAGDAFSDAIFLRLGGNYDTVLEAYYWLVLGERLASYYNRSFAAMMRKADRWEWNDTGDKTHSLYGWSEYQRGNIVPTATLLRYHTGPLDARRNGLGV